MNAASARGRRAIVLRGILAAALLFAMLLQSALRLDASCAQPICAASAVEEDCPQSPMLQSEDSGWSSLAAQAAGRQGAASWLASLGPRALRGAARRGAGDGSGGDFDWCRTAGNAPLLI